MKLFIALIIFGCILQQTLADVSHLEHNNKNRNYLPPDLDRNASEQVYHKVTHGDEHNVHGHHSQHHHNHATANKYNQHEEHGEKKHQHADIKHIKHSKPRPLTAGYTQNRIKTYETSGTSPKPSYFTPARNDFDTQASELVYANAPNSLFHTQINVQSQDSDFSTNAGQQPNGAGAGAPPPPPPTTRFVAIIPVNDPQSGAGPFPVNGVTPGNAPSAPFGVLNFAASYRDEAVAAANRVEASAPAPFKGQQQQQQQRQQQPQQQQQQQQQQKENKQGYNVIHGNVADDDLPERNFLRNREGNVQGVNVIGGNILGGRTSDSRAVQNFDNTAATNLEQTYAHKDSHGRDNKKETPYVRPYYDKDDFKYEPSAANTPEVIYRPGDEINFADVQLRESGFDETADTDTSHAASDTDLRADGYHYKEPSVSFTF